METRVDKTDWVIHVRKSDLRIESRTTRLKEEPDGASRIVYTWDDSRVENTAEGVAKFIEERKHEVCLISKGDVSYKVDIDAGAFHRLINTSPETSLVVFSLDGAFLCCKQHVGRYRAEIGQDSNIKTSFTIEDKPVNEAYDFSDCFVINKLD